MKFFGWLGSLFGRTRLDKRQTTDPFIGTTSASGNAINAETALKLSAVWACVRLRSQVIGSLPLHLYGKDKKTADQHPLYRLLHDSPIDGLSIGYRTEKYRYNKHKIDN